MDPRFIEQFSRNAELFPHMIDIPSDRVLISRFSEEDFKAASFLDERLLTDNLQRDTFAWTDIENISLPGRAPPYYIFHIGHVGSTLLARLLGEHKDILALREPHILRSFAEIGQIKTEFTSPWSPSKFDQRLGTVTTWLSRGFHPEQRSLIKASSFVSEVADQLVTDKMKALCLYVPLETYLATIFAGEASRQEARQLAVQRLTRLHRRLKTPFAKLWELSEGQIIALGWLTEMITLRQTLGSKTPSHVKWQNFDDFLKTPEQTLTDISKHFGAGFNYATAENLIAGPIMRSYSKAPEHDYSPNLRRDVLLQAKSEHRQSIKLALDWVTLLAKTHTEIAELMNAA